jgi:hypothetical protein
MGVWGINEWIHAFIYDRSHHLCVFGIVAAKQVEITAKITGMGCKDGGWIISKQIRKF